MYHWSDDVLVQDMHSEMKMRNDSDMTRMSKTIAMYNQTAYETLKPNEKITDERILITALEKATKDTNWDNYISNTSITTASRGNSHKTTTPTNPRFSVLRGGMRYNTWVKKAKEEETFENFKSSERIVKVNRTLGGKYAPLDEFLNICDEHKDDDRIDEKVQEIVDVCYGSEVRGLQLQEKYVRRINLETEVHSRLLRPNKRNISTKDPKWACGPESLNKILKHIISPATLKQSDRLDSSEKILLKEMKAFVEKVEIKDPQTICNLLSHATDRRKQWCTTYSREPESSYNHQIALWKEGKYMGLDVKLGTKEQVTGVSVGSGAIEIECKRVLTKIQEESLRTRKPFNICYLEQIHEIQKLKQNLDAARYSSDPYVMYIKLATGAQVYIKSTLGFHIEVMGKSNVEQISSVGRHTLGTFTYTDYVGQETLCMWNPEFKISLFCYVNSEPVVTDSLQKTRKNINITYSLGIDSQEARKKLITFVEYYFRTSVFWDMMPEEVSQSNARLKVWEQIRRAGGHLSLDQNLETEFRRIEFIRKSAPYSMPRGKCYTSAEINIVGDAIYDRASGAILVQLPQYDAMQNSLGGGGIFTTNEHEILQNAMTLFYVSFRGFCNVFFIEQSLKDLEPLKPLRQICAPIGGDPLAARKWCHDRLVEKVSKIVSGRHFLSNEENKVKDPIKFARLLTQLFHLFCMSGKTSMKSERPFEVRFGGLIQKMFSQAQVAFICENERIVSKCGTVSKMDEIPIHVCYKSLKTAGFIDCVKLPTATQITLSVQAFMKKLTAIGQNGITDFLRNYVLIGLTESSVGLTRIEYFRRAGLTDSQVIAQVDPNYFKFANY